MNQIGKSFQFGLKPKENSQDSTTTDRKASKRKSTENSFEICLKLTEKL